MSIMRVLLILVAVLVLLALVGWVTFTNEPGRSSINIETNEIREDTGEVMHKGSELLQDAEQKVTPDERESTAAPKP
jgi:hypothetical protein